MTRLHARLSLFAITAIFLATAGNALFMQERAGLPSTSVSVTQFPADRPAPSAEPKSPGKGEEAKGQRLNAALKRELFRRGYLDQEILNQPKGLKLAVLAYEFDSGLNLTGEPTEALLKRVLFDMNPGPRGAFADRAELNPRLVIEAQKMLLGLGFFRGAFSGRMDVWTSGAIKDFERHRGLAQTGRLSGETLLELIAYSGQNIVLSSR
jgi:peptidoglycan hydrolase-like protein with peptidoglycan-binding domain